MVRLSEGSGSIESRPHVMDSLYTEVLRIRKKVDGFRDNCIMLFALSFERNSVKTKAKILRRCQ